MTTASSLARKIKDLLNDLLERNLILLPNATVAIRDRTVTWRAPSPLSEFVDFAEYPTIRTYRRWAEAGEYSALLPDGALLQMTYGVADGEIAEHRLAYVPCPYRLDQDLLVTEPISDVVDLHSDTPHDDITMQTTVRFDYAPSAAAPGHPLAHLTLNVSNCRIACESPMEPGSFVKFVYRHFYKHLWSTHQVFFEALPEAARQSTVTDEERAEPHLAWRHPN